MHTVTIEILRPGQPHNLGLSKATKYIALCGSNPPVTLRVNCNQALFDQKKELLRYVGSEDSDRLKGIEFFKVLITKILDGIEPLRIEGNTDDWLHLRLVITPRELMQLPFELALTPTGFQGQHAKWFLLNPQRLTTLTREVRQIASSRYRWPYKPRILFAWAEPNDTVPHEQHYYSLREIVKNFACPLKNNAEPIPDLAPHITLLKDASLKSINDAVRTAIADGRPYTHLHILAHGIKSENNTGEEFKLVLHDNDDVNEAYYTNGEELANAILEIDGHKTNFPAIVSLMACDSSNEGSFTLPAGSLAHQLHQSGIPCVFASQFPLSVAGSVKLVSILYSELLINGNDPRIALYEIRKTLFDNKTHDWASFVAYVRFPEDIDDQLKDNRLKILLESMKTANSWADHILRYKNEIDRENITKVFEDVKNRLDNSIKHLEEIFKEGKNERKTVFAEHYGLLGSACKRKAEHLFRMAEFNTELTESLFNESLKALNESRQWYFNGYDNQKNHWTAIQYLSLTAVTSGLLNEQKERDIWTVAKILAEDDAKEGNEPMRKIWSWGTLAELYLLYPLTLSTGTTDDGKTISYAIEKASQYLAGFAQARIQFAADLSVKPADIIFAQESTYRQLERYISWWPVMMPSLSLNLLKQMATELLKIFTL